MIHQALKMSEDAVSQIKEGHHFVIVYVKLKRRLILGMTNARLLKKLSIYKVKTVFLFDSR